MGIAMPRPRRLALGGHDYHLIQQEKTLRPLSGVELKSIRVDVQS